MQVSLDLKDIVYRIKPWCASREFGKSRARTARSR
jgi:hypothetical protein